MAQVIKYPETVSFGKNPIIVGFKSDSTQKTFLKAVLEATLFVIDSDGNSRYVRGVKYSIPLDLASGMEVRFDLKSLVEVAKLGYGTDPNCSIGIVLKDQLVINVKIYEEYIENGRTVRNPDPDSASFPLDNHRGGLFALQGGLTDYERIVYFGNGSNTLVGLLGKSRILSRKPKGELIHPESFFIVPAVINSSLDVKASILVNGKDKYGEENIRFDSYRCLLLRQSISDLIAMYPDAKTLSAVIGDDTSKIAYIGKKKGTAYHFSFKNGLGMLESITCYSREKVTANMETTESVNTPDRSLGNAVTSFSRKGEVSVSYHLSTGFINKEWAQWFVSEFFASDECYMSVEGDWVPVSIIPDDTTTLYDETKPVPISLDFTVKPQFSGFINDNFIKKQN